MEKSGKNEKILIPLQPVAYAAGSVFLYAKFRIKSEHRGNYGGELFFASGKKQRNSKY